MIEEKEINGTIYKITNTVNGKIYVGQTIERPAKKRFYKHIWDSKNKKQTYLHNAIAKYGAKNFTFEIIEENIINKVSLIEREIYWINFYNSCDRTIGYNLITKIDGKLFLSKETKEKKSKAKLGNKNWLGKKHSEETKIKLSKAKLGKKISKETIEKRIATRRERGWYKNAR